MGASRPYASSKPLAIEELELDPPGPGEVLVRIKAAGLCHSDLSVINGDRPRPLPMALGHEAAGIVEEVGPGRGRPRSAAITWCACSCRPAAIAARAPRAGRPCASRARRRTARARCSRARGGCTGPTARRCTTTWACSGFAEYATVSRRSLVKIDPELPLDEAALFGCAVLTGVGAVVNTARVQAGASVAVIGLGGVGLCALLGAMPPARARSSPSTSPTTSWPSRAQLGATAHVQRQGPGLRRAGPRAATGGGVEFAFELAGSVRALELAYKITRRGGTTVTAGLPPPTATMPLPAVNLVAEERTLKGSYIGTARAQRATSRASSSSTSAAGCRSTG